MAGVLAHYAETGQVLGKGTHDLEGYTLPDKGYFGPGEMPIFDPNFFDIPYGSSEEWSLEKLKQKFTAAGNEFPDEIIEEFKKELVKAVTAEQELNDANKGMANWEDYA